MGRSKDDYINHYGGMRAGENHAMREERWRRIDEICNQIATGNISLSEFDKLDSELERLRGRKVYADDFGALNPDTQDDD